MNLSNFKNILHKTIEFVSIILVLNLISLNLNGQGLSLYNTADSYAGYTLFPSGSNAYLIDNCGKIVNNWSFSHNTALMCNLMPDGNIFWMGALQPNTFTAGGGNSGNLEIRDPNNNLVWSAVYNSANNYGTHHDIEVLPNGNILLVLWEEFSLTEAIQMGRDPSTINNKLWTTKIVEIEAVGTSQLNVVWEWRMKDHLIQDYNSNALNFGVVKDNPQLMNFNIGQFGSDWLHCNSVDYNSETDQILLSLKHVHEIIVIDHSTTTAEAATNIGGIYGKGGDILYRWGNPQNYDRGTASDKILNGQHDARFVRKGFVNEGAITVFNNKGISNNQSSVELFFPTVDSLGYYSAPTSANDPFLPSTSLATFSNGPNGNFYSGIMCGAQGLPNGNILVTVSSTKDIFEIDFATGNVVWAYDLVASGSIFKSIRYLQSDIELTNYNLTPQGTIESPSSPISQFCGPITYEPFCLLNYANNNQLTGIENGTIDYETDGLIESTQLIENYAIVDYDSNTEILLLPGFEVKINADFNAFIDGCNNGAGGIVF